MIRNERRVSQEEVADVLRTWPIGKVMEVSADALGTINQTWLITAETGRFALRLSCHEDTAKLQRELDLIARVAGSGIPVVVPVRTPSGEAFLHQDGLWTLSPFAPGTQADREVMTLAQDRGMGRYLAKLLDALEGCPLELAKRRSLRLDVDNTLAKMARYEKLIGEYENASEQEVYALDRLKGRRKWIEAHADATLDGLKRLPEQVIHGDYQEKNVFFDERGDVSALIDWENAWVAPREWELLRTLNFVMFFEVERGRAFIEGYLEGAVLDIDALDQAAWAYGVDRTHQLYLYEDIYDRGNDRARQFLRPGPFQPIYDRWIPLRDALIQIIP